MVLEAGSLKIQVLADWCLARASFPVRGYLSSPPILTRLKGALRGLLYKDANPTHKGSTLTTGLSLPPGTAGCALCSNLSSKAKLCTPPNHYVPALEPFDMQSN